MCLGGGSTPEPVKTAPPAPPPAQVDPDLDMADMESDSAKRNKKARGKSSLRIGVKSEALGTTGLQGNSALQIKK
jgi:hypothetical protein